jgi:hypothetical protein
MSIMDKPPEWRRWFGRKVFLTDKATHFRCGGLNVTRMSPVSFISEETQVNQVIDAINSGILIDITDNPRGLVLKGIGHSPTKMEDTGKRIYITTGKDGGLAIKAAETPEEIAVCEAQIASKGIIIPNEYKLAKPLDVTGRLEGGDASLVLHNLEEKIASANAKVFGDLPTIKPGPHKVS